MNLLSRLERMHETYGDEVFQEAADALSLEQLISDKLYRSLLLSLSSSRSDRINEIISEAMQSYEMNRLSEISSNSESF